MIDGQKSGIYEKILIKEDTRTNEDFLEILFSDRNQVDHKIAWGLGPR